MSDLEPLTRIRRGPDALTSHFANGGGIDTHELEWIALHLAEMRAAEPSKEPSEVSNALKRLKRIYLGARVIQGSIIAGRLALPAVVEAGECLRSTKFLAHLDAFADVGAAQVELYLSGATDGRPRTGNDYPEVLKKYISALSGLLEPAYGRAYDKLKADQPDVWRLALDADELQRLCWGHIRLIVANIVSDQEFAACRYRPLQTGTEELLELVRTRTGVALPPRIMQRDSQDYIQMRQDWMDALKFPRQDPRLALLSGIRFSVENAEIATLYCLGSLLLRVKAGASGETVLRQHVRHGVQDIAWGTHLVTHNARFQSRMGARPNYCRSFSEFLRNVAKQAAGSPVLSDGRIDWVDMYSPQVRGWCPAQNKYDLHPDGGIGDVAKLAEDELSAWKKYAKSQFGVEPEYAEHTVGELLASIVVFTLLHDDSPFLPNGAVIRELAARI